MRRRGAGVPACLTLLLLYLLGGGWGLPVLDAVVYHTAEAADRGPHVEPDGGCGHADACLLGVGTAPSGASVGYLPVGRSAATLRRAPALHPDPPEPSPLRSSQRPRAPPHQIA